MGIFGVGNMMDITRERQGEVREILEKIKAIDIKRNYAHAKRAYDLHISGVHANGISYQALAEAFSGLVDSEKKRNALIEEYNNRIMDGGCRATFDRIEPTHYSETFPM